MIGVESGETRSNMKGKSIYRRSLAAVLVAGTLVLAGCAHAASGVPDGGDSRRPPPAGLINEQGEAGNPVDTGALSFSTQSLAAVLDPAKTAARGESGGSELAAAYDVLVRYDGDTNEFQP